MSLEKELEKDFGIELTISTEVDRNGLPRYLTSGRELYRAQNEEGVFYVVRLFDAVDSRVLHKELAIYEENFHAPVAFWFDEMTKSNRNAYVRHHIPFIMLPTQVYLPFLGTLLSRKFSGRERTKSLPLTPNAQKILFYLICREKGGISKRQISQDLQMDPVYVTRGTKELVSRRFVSEAKKGRYTMVTRDAGSRELFDQSRTALVDPVSKVIYVKKTNAVIALPKASDYALSEIGMLNPPNIKTYACHKKCDLIASFEIIEEPEWQEPENICRVELWHYDPLQLSVDGMVDELSLYCSLMDSKDARVLGELEEMLEGRKWL